MPAGRPTTYTPEIADEFCQRLAEGRSVTAVCASDPKFPEARTIFRWLRQYPEFSQNYARAQAERSEAMFEDMLAIADDPTGDQVTRYAKDGSEYEATDYENIQRSRLRVDTRKWALAKMSPKKYGDKVAIGGDPDAPPIQWRFAKPGEVEEDGGA